MSDLTTEYDEIMNNPDSVAESLVNSVTDTGQSFYGYQSAKLIQLIEKEGNKITRNKLLLELANHIVDITTDDVTAVAQSLVDKGPC